MELYTLTPTETTKPQEGCHFTLGRKRIAHFSKNFQDVYDLVIYFSASIVTFLVKVQKVNFFVPDP